MTETTRPPIFIVGVPRSGTTLLAAMLGAHSHISCGAETHFFSAAAQRMESPDDLLRDWPEAAVTFLDGLDLAGRRVLEVHGLTAAGARACLAARPPAVTAVLEAITAEFMRAQGKKRWCEKTPGHIEHVRLIRRYYPTAPILLITRDPRDVALSLLKVPWGPTTILGALQEWVRLHEAGAALAGDARAMTLSYEGLLAEPAATMQRVCAFLDEPYEPAMLDRAGAAVTVNVADEPWKARTTGPLDATRAGAWQTQLTTAEQGLALLLTGRYLTRLGYEGPLTPVQVVGLRALAADPAACEFVYRERLTIDPARPHQCLLFAGRPDRDGWLGGGSASQSSASQSSASRGIATLRLLWAVAVTRATGRRVVWLPAGSTGRAGGWCERVLSRVLAGFPAPVR